MTPGDRAGAGVVADRFRHRADVADQHSGHRSAHQLPAQTTVPAEDEESRQPEPCGATHGFEVGESQQAGPADAADQETEEDGAAGEDAGAPVMPEDGEQHDRRSSCSGESEHRRPGVGKQPAARNSGQRQADGDHDEPADIGRQEASQLREHALGADGGLEHPGDEARHPHRRRSEERARRWPSRPSRWLTDRAPTAAGCPTWRWRRWRGPSARGRRRSCMRLVLRRSPPRPPRPAAARTERRRPACAARRRAASRAAEARRRHRSPGPRPRGPPPTLWRRRDARGRSSRSHFRWMRRHLTAKRVVSSRRNLEGVNAGRTPMLAGRAGLRRIRTHSAGWRTEIIDTIQRVAATLPGTSGRCAMGERVSARAPAVEVGQSERCDAPRRWFGHSATSEDAPRPVNPRKPRHA